MFDLIGDIIGGAVDLVCDVVKDAGNLAMEGAKYLSNDDLREKAVEKLKNYFTKTYKPQLNAKVKEVNAEIPPLNEKIDDINDLRQNYVGPKISVLKHYLGNFGQIKAIEEYTGESYFDNLQIPQQKYEEIADYIKDKDFSDSEVLLRIATNLFSIRSKNKKASIKIEKKINDLKLELEFYLKVLEARKKTYIQNREIADMYISTINMILDFIDKKITPEFERIEGFFEADRLKDELLTGKCLTGKNIVFNNNIKILIGTPYEKHYLFIKNTFMFYIIACKIYSSPILTRLLQGETQSNEQIYQNDFNQVKSQIDALQVQKSEVTAYLTMGGNPVNGKK